jgi:hypothetical protein
MIASLEDDLQAEKPTKAEARSRSEAVPKGMVNCYWPSFITALYNADITVLQ